MNITKKIINLIWTIALLVSLPGCINFKPDIKPLEVSSPISTPSISILGDSAVAIDSAWDDCDKTQQALEKCFGDGDLGWDEVNGLIRVFVNGQCYLLDSSKDANDIAIVKNTTVKINGLNEDISLLDGDINLAGLASGLGVGGLIATIAGAVATCIIAGAWNWGLGCVAVIAGVVFTTGLSIVEIVDVNNKIGQKDKKVEERNGWQSTLDKAIKNKQGCTSN